MACLASVALLSKVARSFNAFSREVFPLLKLTFPSKHSSPALLQAFRLDDKPVCDLFTTPTTFSRGLDFLVISSKAFLALLHSSCNGVRNRVMVPSPGQQRPCVEVSQDCPGGWGPLRGA